jgi:CBS domain-containing protein
MHSAIFFDFRSGFGDSTLADELRQHLVQNVPRHEVFMLYLAKNALEARPPLSFFRNFIVEKHGEHKNALDLKKNGLAPFVDFARLAALKHGIRENNTMGRIQLLHEGGHISQDLYSEATEAYEFLMQLRLLHQLRMLEEDETPNNHINPADLTDLEKQTLKEAFEVVRRLQSHIRLEYRLAET